MNFAKLMVAAVSITTFIIGCATKSITLPDGTQGYAVECKGSLAICYKKASNLCPTGYDVIEDDKEKSGSAGATAFYGVAASKTVITRVVRCKTTVPAAPVAH